MGATPGIDASERRTLAAPDATPGGEPAQGFSEVYAEHAAFAWRTLRRLGVREAEVEDACQEVFLVVHRRLDDFDWQRPMQAWVFGICAKVAARYRRRAGARYEQATAEPPAEVAADQSKFVERREAEVLLEQILSGLGEEQRAIFILYEFEQLSMAEVAVAVGCPLQTAYSRLHATRKYVKKALQRMVGPR